MKPAILLSLILITGCSSMGDTIIGGAEGNLTYKFQIDLGIIEPIGFEIGGTRTKDPDVKRDGTVEHVIE